MQNQVNRIYQSGQMLKACPIPVEKCGQIKIKVVSEQGQSNWFNITPAQFRAIEEALANNSQGD